ncbi:PEP-CTERM sorting domain-containing protein [Zoogloea sp.]|uniref:PEP-CTERM sorting domain-containing protein n=1 Tax=Zoogloea sp. TaxID=49181 RepID=UPI0031FCB0E8
MNASVRKLIAVALTCSAGVASASLINTTTMPYSGSWAPFSDTNTATYGQTFKSGADTVLDSFTLYLDHASRTVDFKAYVYAWNGSKAVGQALYSSDVQHFSGTQITGFTFNTGGLQLNSSLRYVAFLSTSGIAGGEDGSANMPNSGSFGSNPYADGDFVYFNNGDNFNALTTNAWDMTGGQGDVWFQASFSGAALAARVAAIPEPATMGLTAAALGAVALVRRRRNAA